MFTNNRMSLLQKTFCKLKKYLAIFGDNTSFCALNVFIINEKHYIKKETFYFT